MDKQSGAHVVEEVADLKVGIRCVERDKDCAALEAGKIERNRSARLAELNHQRDHPVGRCAHEAC
jgi:hypothetical protein